jgi:hypothetical protein
MKCPFLFLLAAACSLLPLGSNSQAGQAKHAQSAVASPATLAAVRPGMPREGVLAGLSEAYNLNKAPSSNESQAVESWLVTEKAGRGGGVVSFSNGGVHDVIEFLTESESPETVSFVKDLYAYLRPEVKSNASDTGASRKLRATVVVELEETNFRKAGDFVETSSIKFKFKDATYDLFYSDSSFAGSSGPDVKISRVRGTE